MRIKVVRGLNLEFDSQNMTTMPICPTSFIITSPLMYRSTFNYKHQREHYIHSILSTLPWENKSSSPSAISSRPSKSFLRQICKSHSKSNSQSGLPSSLISRPSSENSFYSTKKPRLKSISKTFLKKKISKSK